MSENGPPFPWNPIRFAGTWKQYSKKAIPQLIKMTPMSGRLENQDISLSRKCPYQASVIKMLEMTSIPMT